MSERARWRVERVRASAREIHERPLPDPVEREVWVCEVTGPALVLGSAQHDDGVDRAACAAAGIDVVRRHSGGGAVLVVPDEGLWVEVVLPAGDPLWHEDVGQAFLWLGETWSAALAELGVAAQVHRGRLERSAWSFAVCFAGLGSGEVTVGGRKVVGISQRRTRRGARFQCAALGAWDPGAIVPLLGLPPSASDDLLRVAAPVGTDAPALLAAFLRHLP